MFSFLKPDNDEEEEKKEEVVEEKKPPSTYAEFLEAEGLVI